MSENGQEAYTLGIDIGTSSVKIAALSVQGKIMHMGYMLHGGDVAACLRAQLVKLEERLGFASCMGVMATGSGATSLGEFGIGVEVLGDIPACTRGADVLAPQARSIVQIGGQSACFIAAPQVEGASGWCNGAPEFSVNESCAAGTGSFFEDQMQRLGLPLEEYSQLVAKAASIPRLSGRCAVFAKTDIIHRQQEGVPVEDILLGLCYALVKSYKATIVRSLPVRPPLLLAGGVVRNEGVLRAMSDVFGLEDGELVTGPEMQALQAVGAAAAARETGAAAAPQLLASMKERLVGAAVRQELPRLAALPDEGYVPGRGFELRERPWAVDADGRTPCALGIDVGSTSTNLVLVDDGGALLDAQYLRTRGNPRQAVKDGLASIEKRLGNAVRIVAVGTTGSGRSLIGEMVGADAVRDEITAQARAAAAADPQVDTVFEIGGQDSKYIGLKGGEVADFQMNKICAAGTGSFVEEQAQRLGIPLDEYGVLALSSEAPVDLGERCTVFVETAINAALARGAGKCDIAAGLTLSIVRNYLHKVVGAKPVGAHIVLQGGVAYNPAIVAAFRQYAGDALTVSPWFAVSGAVGAALLAQEEQRAGGDAGRGWRYAPTSFRGFDLSGTTRAKTRASAEEVAKNRAFFRKTEAVYLEGYDPTIDPAKQTVGIPRCLMMHKLFPLANAFFRTLGYNVVVTDASNEQTVALSQQLAQGEVCYPVKLLYGHMEQLARQKVDYIFMPHMHTIRHVKSRVAHNYACPYMQLAPQFVARTLRLEQRGVQLVSPLMDMDFGQQALATALLGVGEQLGHTPQESARAMMAGGVAVQEFTRKIEALGEELLESLAPGERVLVIITRQYNTADPELNSGIADALLDRGQKVITVSHLHAHDLDISQDYPHMYWPFGQHLLSGAKLVRRDPRLYAVYLTNHGCGPDTMVSHLIAEEMGDKPYLQIEMDEHFSQVGIITRIEAFLNALDHYEGADESCLPLAVKQVDSAHERLAAGRPAALASVGPYGPLACSWLQRAGYDVRSLRVGPAALAAARKELTSKEYYSFAAVLGMALQAVGLVGDGRAAPVEQLVLPSSEGSEAEGVYDRVVRSVLDAKGYSDVRVIAPSLEKLPWAVSDAQGLFNVLLAGDVCWAAAPREREALVHWFEEREITFDAVLEGASRAARSWEAAGELSEAKRLLLVGEWWCACSDELTDGLGGSLESGGWRVSRMPLAEYLLFSWYDAAQEDAHERSRVPFFLDQVSDSAVLGLPDAVSGGLCEHGGQACTCIDEGVQNTSLYADEPSFEEKRLVLDRFTSQMSRVREVLGSASCYCTDFGALRSAADALLEGYRGANGRYRAAKTRLAQGHVSGVVAVASMYENTDIALRLLEEAPLPVLHLSFDGVLDDTIDEKLSSFLYYL